MSTRQCKTVIGEERIDPRHSTHCLAGNWSFAKAIGYSWARGLMSFVRREVLGVYLVASNNTSNIPCTV